jgi:hypothetical protein
MRYITLFILLSIAVIGLWLSTLWIVPSTYPARDANGLASTQPIENPGIFGDMFGAVNALFTGLSAAGLLVALLMQAKQLRDQADDQARLNAAQEKIVDLTGKQAQAMEALAQQVAATNRRQSIEFIVQSNIAEIERLRPISQEGHVRGTPQAKRVQDATSRIRDLESQNKSLRLELTQKTGEVD